MTITVVTMYNGRVVEWTVNAAALWLYSKLVTGDNITINAMGRETVKSIPHGKSKALEISFEETK